MPVPYFGGFEYVDAGLLGPRAVYVDLETAYTNKLFQLYAGRTLIGCTGSVTDTRVSGQVTPTDSPCPLTVVAVDPSDAATDFGSLIPNWPWNRYAVSWSTSGSPSDMDHFLVCGSDAPGGSADQANVLKNVPFIGDGNYSVDLAPVNQCGTWQFGVTPYDNALPTGNAGTMATVNVVATIPPPDLVLDSEGNRFEAATVGGNLNVSCTYPS